MAFMLADTGLADLGDWLADPFTWMVLMWPGLLYIAVILLFWFLFWCPFIRDREPGYLSLPVLLLPGFIWCGPMAAMCVFALFTTSSR